MDAKRDFFLWLTIGLAFAFDPFFGRLTFSSKSVQAWVVANANTISFCFLLVLLALILVWFVEARMWVASLFQVSEYQVRICAWLLFGVSCGLMDSVSVVQYLGLIEITNDGYTPVTSPDKITSLYGRYGFGPNSFSYAFSIVISLMAFALASVSGYSWRHGQRNPDVDGENYQSIV